MGGATPNPRRREPLDRDRILRAALRLIDQHGLAELSMRRLGAELGVQAMAVYRHLPSKQAVIEGVREMIFDELAALRPTETPSGRWDDGLVALAHAFRDACRRHPHALSLFATDVDRGYAASASLHEPALRRLVDAGFPLVEAAEALRIVVRYVLATELLVLSVTTVRHPLTDEEIDRMGAEHPLVGQLVRSLTVRTPDSLEDPGLELIVAGLRQRLASYTGAHGGGGAT